MSRENNELWLEKLNVLKSYINEFHKFPTSTTEYQGHKIGGWLSNQRSANNIGNLSEFRIDELNKISPYWNGTPTEVKNENMRFLLESDWKSKIPEGNTPIDLAYDGVELYKYLNNGIYDCETLITDHFNKLHVNDIDIIYSAILQLDKRYFTLMRCVYDIDIKSPQNVVDYFKQLYYTSSSDFEEKINNLLKTLTERECKVIKYRFGLEDGINHTLEETGKLFKVTRDRTRQIEAKACRKLRHPIRRKELKKTNTELDEYMDILYDSTRYYLCIKGIDTKEKIIEYANNNEVTDDIKRLLQRFTDENDTLIEDIDDINNSSELSIRSYNCLKRAGIEKFSQFLTMYQETPERVYKIRNLGQKSIDEILEIIRKNKIPYIPSEENKAVEYNGDINSAPIAILNLDNIIYRRLKQQTKMPINTVGDLNNLCRYHTNLVNDIVGATYINELYDALSKIY